MDFLLHYPPAIAFVLAFILLFYLRRISTRRHKGKGVSAILPPEPPGGWPVIGHLRHFAGSKPLALKLAAMADDLGPIFSIRFGVRRAVVVSSWEAVKECFTTNDRVFAARPHSATSKHLSYNSAAFGFAPYGPYWRHMRKLAVIELLRHVRVSEIEAGMNELYRLGESPVVISEWLEQLTLNIIVRMIAGKRYFARGEAAEEEESKRFRRVIKEFMYASGDFPVSDLIPFPPLRWLDSISGALKRVKRVMEEVDWFVERWIEEHQQRRLEGGSSGEQEGDFIDVMLSTIDDTFASEHTRQTIVKATTMNLILAGSDTTSVHLTWILSALLNNRRELKRAQEEIDSKVGKDRWVQDSDINNLVYLQAIVKETLRLYPPGPLSVPHLSTENCTIGGYFIPSGTRLLVNTWKLHRDPRVWSEPDKFMPERFLTRHADVDVSGHNFEFTPFGSGRRACPGIALAFQVSHLTLARLLQGFEFETPSGEPVDMAGGSGLTMPKVEPLKVRLTPRLASKLYE